MLQNNPLLAQLKQQLHQQAPRVEGIVKATDKSFGFLETDNQKSYFIAPPQMKKVMHGDRISAAIYSEEGKERAEPEQLLTSALQHFVGKVQIENDRYLIKVEQPALNVQIACQKGSNFPALYTLRQGDWCEARLIHHPLNDQQPFLAELTQFIARDDNPQLPWLVTLSRLGLAHEPPYQDNQQDWQMVEYEIRRDLTGFDFITIDGDSTEDIDDALFIQRNTTGSWELLVAIADPNCYIQAGSELDNEAQKRAFTCYLPGMNIPMLPRVLSEDLCSLQPNQVRPALVCRFTVEDDGELIEHCQFFTAWIKSKEKLSYDNVSDYLERTTVTQWQPSSPSVEKQLRLLDKFYQARHFWRRRYAVIFQDKKEFRFQLDANYQPIRLKQEKRRIANNIVEEAMICANICAAHYLQKHLGFGVYNTHNGFDKNQINQVTDLLLQNNLVTTPEDLLSLSGFAKLQREFLDIPQPVLEYQLRRYQTFSEITNQPGPHFGLGLPLYATWTSPIRKYGDLINHRLLKAIIRQQPIAQPDEAIVKQMMERRRLTRIAERDVTDWLYCQFLQPHLAEQAHLLAEVIDITRGGLRVRLSDYGAIAFMPLSLLHENRQQITVSVEQGKITINDQLSYQIGQSLTVQLTEIRPNNRNIIAKPIK